MLIDSTKIIEQLNKSGIKITGAFHIGAHDCEELSFYKSLNLKDTDVFWIDAYKKKVIEARNKEIPNVYHATITDKDNEIVTFNLTNNIQSSSILDLGTHATEYPYITYVEKISQSSITVDSFFKNNHIDPSRLNFWNLDIQGAELLALKGSINSIKYADAIYLEVNIKHLYKDCALLEEIDNFLSIFNFERRLTDITGYGWGDALYIRKCRCEANRSM